MNYKYILFLIAIFTIFILSSCGNNGGQWEFRNIKDGDIVNGTIVFVVDGGRLDNFEILCNDDINYADQASIQWCNEYYEITLDTTDIPNGNCIMTVETISEHSDFDSPAPAPASLSITINNNNA